MAEEPNVLLPEGIAPMRFAASNEAGNEPTVRRGLGNVNLRGLQCGMGERVFCWD